MWRQCIILWLTFVCCFAIPRSSGKRELQRLVRLPRIEFASPLVFDRTSGFVVFPNEGAAATEAAEALKDLKGTPADAPMFLEAARIFARGGDVASSIRSYARAFDLFGRKAELEPENASALIGLADACIGFGRFGEAQAALDKAALINGDDAEIGLARFHKEKAWSAFAGEENRFSSSKFIDTLAGVVRKGGGVRIETAKRELDMAAELFAKRSEKLTNSAAFLRERSTFRSFHAALQSAFAQVQGAEKSVRELRRSIFARDALSDLNRIKQLRKEDPEAIAVAAFSKAFAETAGLPAQMGVESRESALQSCRELQEIANSGSKRAGEAAELLGCAQIFLIDDFHGGERSFRAALRVEPIRERSWDLLVLSLATAGSAADLVEACEERTTVLPTARSSAMLIKSYDRQGDSTRAELNALLAAGLYPHDFYVNLSLAAVLLKREDAADLLWRVADALSKAEKQLGAGTSQQGRLDFVLLKGIYLGLSDQPEQAKALLEPYSSSEAQDVLRALDF